MIKFVMMDKVSRCS